MRPIVILGAGGHAKVAADAVTRQGLYSVAGFLDQAREAGCEHFGYRILGREDDLPGLAESLGLAGFLVALGANGLRKKATERVRALVPDLNPVSIIHPSATVAQSADMGPGTVVMAGAVIGPDCRIGQGCIINHHASLDHDSTMGGFSSLAPGAITGGNVRIGTGAAICIGATVSHGIAIGDHCVLGAGAVALSDQPGASVCLGVPARKIRSRSPGDQYL